MKSDSWGYFIGLFVCGVICSVIAYWREDALWEKRIIDHGVAEYYLDINHNRQWRWKDCDQNAKILNSKTVIKPLRTFILPDFTKLVCEANCK